MTELKTAEQLLDEILSGEQEPTTSEYEAAFIYGCTQADISENVTNPDWCSWLGLPEWTPKQAVCLLYNINPLEYDKIKNNQQIHVLQEHAAFKGNMSPYQWQQFGIEQKLPFPRQIRDIGNPVVELQAEAVMDTTILDEVVAQTGKTKQQLVKMASEGSISLYWRSPKLSVEYFQWYQSGENEQKQFRLGKNDSPISFKLPVEFLKNVLAEGLDSDFKLSRLECEEPEFANSLKANTHTSDIPKGIVFETYCNLKPPRSFKEMPAIEITDDDFRKIQNGLVQQKTEAVGGVVQPDTRNCLKPSGLLSLPSRQDDWVSVIDDTVKVLHDEMSKMPNEVQVWGRMATNPPQGYKVTSGKDKGDHCLNITGIDPLSRSAFSKRWKKYTSSAQ
ncbi:MAG: hypothetical protein CTY34_07670 [Methylobacter sp.]|nr:MAG: hypothetical protein CTY34_07670 [Methylobacter sp.]